MRGILTVYPPFALSGVHHRGVEPEHRRFHRDLVASLNKKGEQIPENRRSYDQRTSDYGESEVGQFPPARRRPPLRGPFGLVCRGVGR